MPTLYRIDGIEVDPHQRCVRRDGEVLYLRARSFDLLIYLIEHRDEVVSKERLFAYLWKDISVTDNSLVQCVNDIRKALGDDARNPCYVKTVAKAGYQFIGPVQEDSSANLGPYQEEAQASSRETLRQDHRPQPRNDRLRTWVWVATAVACSMLAGALLFRLGMPAAPGHRTVAVLPFENQSGTAELDWLREGLPDMLITSLSRRPALSVLSRQQVHELVGRRGLKNRDGIVVNGTFAKLGDVLRIGVEIQDSHTGQLLGAESLVAERPEQIVAEIDLLALKIVARLGSAAGSHADEAKNRPPAALSTLMTNNLEAYRNYSLGVEAAQALHTQQAIVLLQKAVDLDPNFAMAEARIGYTYAVRWDRLDEARPFLERAYRLSTGLSDQDRLNIAAWYAIANLDFGSAIRTYQEIVSKHTDDVEAYARLGELLIGEQRYEEAIDTLQRSLIVDPDNPDTHNALHHAFAFSGNFDASIAEAQRYAELAPSEPNALDSLGYAYQIAERYPQAEDSYRRALTLDPKFDIAAVHLGNVYFQTGRYRDAISQYRRFMDVAPSDVERSRGLDYLIGIYLHLGLIEKADAAREAFMRVLPGASPYGLLLAVHQRDLVVTDDILRRMPPYHSERGRRGQHRKFGFMQGHRAMLAGKSDEAISWFREALRNPPPYFDPEWLEDCLGDAYLQLGRLDEAIIEYQRALKVHPGLALARFHLAAAYDRKGNREQARAEYIRFLDLWKNADADIPEVIEARKRRASL